MDHATIFVVLACVIGFLMTWGVGANDLANIMSTTMGSKAITIQQAMLVAIIFEFAGAFLGSTGVSNTIRHSIINASVLDQSSDILIYGMLAVLMAGSTWMLLASIFGLPVSITNAIVGSLVGFGSVVMGLHAIHWSQVRWIALSWLISPFFAGLLAYLLFLSVQRSILVDVNPLEKTQRYLPVYFLLVGIVLAFMTVLKGIKHFAGVQLSFWTNFGILFGTSIIIMLLGLFLSRFISKAPDPTGHDRFAPVERLFSLLMAFTACAMVFAHGSNDVAIAVGPMAAIISIAQSNDHLYHATVLPNWIIFIGTLGVITGFLMYGRKVIETVGKGITALTPSRAFAATLAAAVTVIIFTSIGIPVSATQALVGGVMGVGLARGIGALNLNIVRNILLSWLITIPAASILAIGFYYLLKYLFTL